VDFILTFGLSYVVDFPTVIQSLSCHW